MFNNKYIVRLDENNNIVWFANTFDYNHTDIEITSEAYENCFIYKKYNPETGEFLEPIEDSEVMEKEKLSQGNYLMDLDTKLNKIIEHLGI